MGDNGPVHIGIILKRLPQHDIRVDNGFPINYQTLASDA